MLKLVHDATANAVDDPETDDDRPRRAVPDGRPRDAGRGTAGRAPGLPRGPRLRARRHGQAPGGRQRVRPDPGGDDGGRHGRGERAAGRRPPRGRALQLGHLAGLHAQVAQGDRGAADLVPARAVDRGLRPALGEFFGAEAGLSASARSTGSPWPSRPSTPSGARGISPASTTSISGSTGCTSTSASKRTACAAWSSWVCAPTGPKELVALADGYRESTESWAEVLRSLKDRGLVAPVLAVGDGALGFWAALRDVFPETREQRCWVHVTANCLDALPKRLHADAKEAIAKIYSAPSRTAALEAVKAFADEFSAFPKAAKKITGQLDVLLAFYDFPVEHWIHLRTTNPIESTFSTVRLRTKVTRGAGSRKAGSGHGLQAARRRPGSLAPHQRPRARPAGPRRRNVHRRQATREECDDDRQRQQHRVRRRLIENPLNPQ